MSRSFLLPVLLLGVLLGVALGLGVVWPVGAEEGNPATGAPGDGLARATFAGGCFWCMEPPFDKLEGVISTTSGYTGGPEVRPTYKEVSWGRTGHTEAVEIVYDPALVSYEQLLAVFWHNIDPTVENRQFCDQGTQYRTAIFAHDEDQLRLAQASKQALEARQKAGELFSEPLVTPILAAEPFYPAETYHQNFYKKNPQRYHSYRRGCGRDARLHQLWGDAAGGAGEGKGKH